MRPLQKLRLMIIMVGVALHSDIAPANLWTTNWVPAVAAGAVSDVEKEVARLIEELSSPRWSRRQAAAKALGEIGPAAKARSRRQDSLMIDGDRSVASISGPFSTSASVIQWVSSTPAVNLSGIIS